MLLEGKTGVVFGVANKRSLAWAIARRAAEEGARIALTYQGERLEENARELATSLKDPLVLPCDVTRDEDIEAVFARVKEEFGGLDFVVHGVAYALREELEGDYINTSREGYRISQDISVYSLTAIAKAAMPLMEGRGGSIITLTYLGGERVIPGYNVMGIAKAALDMSVRYLASNLGPRGIRVNGISAGPVKTLASAGIGGFSKILEHMRNHAPLRRNVDQSEVADAALFLLSDMSRGVTGEILHVDSGYNIMGM
ncbi:MAG TPA: enoyl-ACP reductase [Blastocatellia bacterium]|jgi:enoyl-[acyl-carrier protein] reductase I|nr:enoyl-ACP reductase [Blastocatellia bacterium]